MGKKQLEGNWLDSEAYQPKTTSEAGIKTVIEKYQRHEALYRNVSHVFPLHIFVLESRA